MSERASDESARKWSARAHCLDFLQSVPCSSAEMSSMSSSLRDESLKYRKAAKQIRIDALIRQYAP